MFTKVIPMYIGKVMCQVTLSKQGFVSGLAPGSLRGVWALPCHMVCYSTVPAYMVKPALLLLPRAQFFKIVLEASPVLRLPFLCCPLFPVLTRLLYRDWRYQGACWGTQARAIIVRFVLPQTFFLVAAAHSRYC